MAPKRRVVPPIRPNADGTGFVRVSTTGEPLRGSAERREECVEQARASRGRPPAASDDALGRRSSCYHSPLHYAQAPRKATSEEEKSSSPQASGAPPVHTTGGAAQQTESNRQQTSPAPQREGASAAVRLGLRVDASLLANECRASATVLGQLRISSGGVVRVSTAFNEDSGAAVACLEAFLSANCPRDALLVAEETMSVLCSHAETNAATNARRALRGDAETVEVTAVKSDALPVLTCVHLQAFVDTEGGPLVMHAAARADTLPGGAELFAWRALFRQAFHHRIVYTGMRSTLRMPSAHRAVVEVTAVVGAKDGGFGVLDAVSDIFLGEGLPKASPTTSLPVATEAMVNANAPDAVPSLVVGEAGTGKSHYLSELAEVLRARGGQKVFVLRVEDVPQGGTSEVASATALREVLAAAKHAAPATVLVDDLHLLCGRGGSGAMAGGAVAGSDWAVALVVSSFCEELRDIAVRRLPIQIVASAPSVEALDSALTQPERLGARVLRLSPPATAAERERCLRASLASLKLDKATCSNGEREKDDCTSLSDSAIAELARDGHGYTQRDLRRVVEAAVMESFRRCGTVAVKDVDLRVAAKMVRPSALRQFEVSVPAVTWDDIGGSDDAKQTLQEVVEWCLGKQSWVFTEFNLSPPKGVLLYGPPGCSKTMLAKALANESRMNFISVKGPEVFSKWVGDSEKAVRDIFARARAAAPCVVFIDELDGMCGHRGRGGVSDRVISQFLTELDGLPSSMESASNRVTADSPDAGTNTSTGSGSKALVFVAATNRPDNIDGAVLRPGRIDRCVHVGLPAVTEREAIARIQLRKLPTDPALTPAYVAARTEGYTGAEVVAVVKEAAFSAIASDVAAACVTVAHIDLSLTKVRPRVDPKDVEWYQNWRHIASRASVPIR